MRRRRLTVGHRNLRNPRCGFELINAEVRWRLVNRDGPDTPSLRGTLAAKQSSLRRRSGLLRRFALAMTVHAAENAKKRNTAVDNVMTPL
jgi:hypothetical protein